MAKRKANEGYGTKLWVLTAVDEGVVRQLGVFTSEAYAVDDLLNRMDGEGVLGEVCRSLGCEDRAELSFQMCEQIARVGSTTVNNDTTTFDIDSTILKR